MLSFYDTILLTFFTDWWDGPLFVLLVIQLFLIVVTLNELLQARKRK